MAIDEHDMNQEGVLWPWVDDPGIEASDEENYEDSGADLGDPGDVDSDHESGFTSAGWGTDESYGCYGEEW